MSVRAVATSVRSNRGRYHRCDHAGVHLCEDVVAIYLPPFIPLRGLAQMLGSVIDMLPALPIFVAHLRAFLPFLMTDELMVVVVIRDCLCIGRNHRHCE